MYGIHHYVILVTYVYILYTVDLTQYALLPLNSCMLLWGYEGGALLISLLRKKSAVTNSWVGGDELKSLSF